MHEYMYICILTNDTDFPSVVVHPHVFPQRLYSKNAKVQFDFLNIQKIKEDRINEDKQIKSISIYSYCFSSRFIFLIFSNENCIRGFYFIGRTRFNVQRIGIKNGKWKFLRKIKRLIGISSKTCGKNVQKSFKFGRFPQKSLDDLVVIFVKHMITFVQLDGNFVMQMIRLK